LRVELPRLRSQSVVRAACYDSFGTIVSDRVVTCLTCYRLRRAWNSGKVQRFR
jgi:hypothetical protein